jgi:hypothetical protein
MKLFNKTAIALTLSLLGAVSSVSALAMATDNIQHQEVEIKVEGDELSNMNVFVSIDDEVTSLDVSSSVMNNPEELRKLLADVPEDIREKLIERLTSLDIQGSHFKMVVDGDINQELHILSKDDHNIKVMSDDSEKEVIVMEFDNDTFEGELTQKIIEKMIYPSHNKNVQVIHQGSMSSDSMIRMIKHSDFTADELNEIQQALDAKR